MGGGGGDVSCKELSICNCTIKTLYNFHLTIQAKLSSWILAFSSSPVLGVGFPPSAISIWGTLPLFYQVPLRHLERLCCQSFLCGFVCFVDFITPHMKCMCAHVWLSQGILIFELFVFNYGIGGFASQETYDTIRQDVNI